MKCGLKNRLLFFLFLVLAEVLYGQDYASRLYTPKRDGLVQMQVMRIRQAPDGKIWACTYGGVSCFDGFTFKSYTERDGLSSYAVNDIAFSGDTVFVATQAGLDAIVDEQIIHLHSMEKKFYSASFYFYGKHKFMATSAINEDSLLRIFDVNKRRFIDIIPSRFYKKIRHHAFLKNTLLISEGVNLYEIDLISQKTRLVCTSALKLWNVNIDAEDVFLWTKTDNKRLLIKRLSPRRNYATIESFTLDIAKFPATSDPSASILCLEKHDFIFSNDEGKIFILINGTLQQIPGNYNSIHNMLLDKEGNVWIATEKGLLKVFLKKYRYFFPEQGYPENVWTAMGISNNEQLLASYNQGLFKIRNGKIIKHWKPKFINNYYNGGCHGFHNNFLIAAAPGIGIFSPVKNSLSIIKDKMPSASLTIYRDEPGKRIMAGNMTKLLAINKNYRVDSLFDVTATGKRNTILAILRKDKQSFYLGLSRGLLQWDETSHKAAFITSEKIRFNDLLRDNHHNLWAATSRGLLLFRGGKYITVSPDMITEDLMTVEIAGNNLLFAAGTRHLFVLDLNRYYAGAKPFLTVYGENAGYFGGEPGQNCFYKDDEGNLWLPTSDNVVKIFPKDFETPFYTLVARINTLSITDRDNIHYQKLDLGNKLIEIPFASNNLRICFPVTELNFPEAVRYSYFLKGYQDEWISGYKNSSVVFSNLPAGEYTFYVKASLTNDFTNAPVSQVSFTILPPFWQTAWFYVIESFVAIMLIMLLLWLTMRHITRRQKNKSELLRLKSATLSKQLDNHFISNCTAKIVVLNESGKIDEASNYARTFSRFMQQNLFFVRKEEITLAEELELIGDYVFLEKKYGINFNFEIFINSNIIPTEILIPPLLLQPLAENAIRHGIKQRPDTTGGLLKIEISRSGKSLLISIMDNGPGFVHQEQSTPKEGNGMSMQLIAERLQLMEGQSSIKVSHSDTEETCIILEIPIKNIRHDKSRNRRG